MKTAAEMTAQEAYTVYRQAQEIMREQRVIVESVKNHYKPLASANGGKVIIFTGPDGQHGFEVAREEGRLSQKVLEKVLAEIGLTAAQIDFVKQNSKGAPGQNFSAF